MGTYFVIAERTCRVAAILVMSCCCAFGQYSNIQTKNGSEFPTVVFSCSRRQANPPYYSIAVDSTGDATYESIPTSVARPVCRTPLNSSHPTLPGPRFSRLQRICISFRTTSRTLRVPSPGGHTALPSSMATYETRLRIMSRQTRVFWL